MTVGSNGQKNTLSVDWAVDWCVPGQSTARSTDVQTKTNPRVKNKNFPEKIAYGRLPILPTVDRAVDSAVDRCVKNTDMHSSLEIL